MYSMQKAKIIPFVLVLMLLLQFSFPAFAYVFLNTDDQNTFDAQLEDILSCVSSDAEGFGITEEELGNSYLAGPIFAYELNENGLEILDYEFYPIISNYRILFFVIKDNNGVSISQGLASELSYYSRYDEPVALVYDKTNCYAVTSDDASLLCTFSQPIPNRYSFSNKSQVVDFSKAARVQLVSINSQQNLSSVFSAVSSASIILPTATRLDLALPVGFVSQNPPSYICWAATIACIGNYLTGSSYTAVQVAQSWYGSSNYNQKLFLSDASSVLYNKYSLFYGNTYSYAPSDTIIANNIGNGFPMYTCWAYSAGSHACTIRGISQSTSYIYVVDPEYGLTIANKTSGNYSYVSSYSATTLTLDSYCAAY